MTDRETTPKAVTIYRDQEEWLKESPINLSKFVRIKLDERIENEKNESSNYN